MEVDGILERSDRAVKPLSGRVGGTDAIVVTAGYTVPCSFKISCCRYRSNIPMGH